MIELFRLSGAIRRDPEVDAWFTGGVTPDLELRRIARTWFDHMRACGPDVGELIHDGCPVACVQDAAFGYVNAFKAHVNVGFFLGAELDDPVGLLEGSGKRMRHVKVRWGEAVDAAALSELIGAAYGDIRARLASPEGA
ncbi:MAG TPA: DUF1801 domain-containing protein [Phenylobacterium sp.]|nr:DUF1801 domain-containing protein [Phenylobacterium sp.]